MLKKYIIIKGSPILFSTELSHADIVKETNEIESAGFFLTAHDEEEKLEVICIGESTSLDIRSRPQIDRKIIADFLKADL